MQVLPGFDTRKQAGGDLRGKSFVQEVVRGLAPLLQPDPKMRICSAD
jgi:hypothetical protein